MKKKILEILKKDIHLDDEWVANEIMQLMADKAAAIIRDFKTYKRVALIMEAYGFTTIQIENAINKLK